MGSGGRSGRQLNLATAAPAAIAEAATASGLTRRQVLERSVAATALLYGVDPTVLGPLGEARSAPSGDLLGDRPGAADPVAPAAAPDRLGAIHQALVGGEDRRTRGVHYTPAAVADAIVALAVDASATRDGWAPVVCDPACGGGAFLLAAARLLHERGMAPGEVLDGLHGIELDPLAADVAVAAVRLWATLIAGASPTDVVRGPRLRVADALALDDWATSAGAPTLIIGNPPFGGQLGRRTARRPPANEVARARLGMGAGYTDTAALFLDRAVQEVEAGGVVALMQPLSLLAARDAGRVRERVGVGRLRGLWVPEGRIFAAAVSVCAPILGDGSAPSVPAEDVWVVRGSTKTPVASVPRPRLESHGSWSALWAAGAGVPVVDLDAARTVGDWCTATAGFRDEFYALAPLVGEDPDPRPAEAPEPGTVRVLTSGLVDPGSTGWGRRPARLAGRDLSAPVLAIAAAMASPERRLAAVVPARSRPKVIVATQTRVVEAVVDDDGRYWPSVPLISVTLRPDLDDREHRWLVAAALMAPPVTAWVLARVGGAARSPDAVKLSGRQVLQVPLPVDDDAWREGAAELAARATGHAGAASEIGSALAAAAPALIAAYGISGPAADELSAWWGSRLEAGARPRLPRS